MHTFLKGGIMKTLWKGSLSFGLVSIPVRLYSATQEHVLGFKLLHEKCHTPINYQRRCPNCDVEVPWQNVVKGYKLHHGKYFRLTKENREKLKPEKTDQLIIKEFVPDHAIAPIYYDEHYYLLPEKASEKAYFLLHDALLKMEMVAVGQFVLREKEYVSAITPYQKGFLLSTLNYAYEIRQSKDLEDLKTIKSTSQELALAQQLIKRLATTKFSISQYKDTFVENLKKRIKRAVKGLPLPKRKKARKIEIPTLVTALQKSLKQQPVAYAKGR
jgi:DNA end-binding protein Ku